MGASTGHRVDRQHLEPAGSTWNPLRARREDGKVGWACVKVSPGCANCYAEALNRRLGTAEPYTVAGLARQEHFLQPNILTAPLHWRAPRRVFLSSMTDVGGDWVTDEQLDQLWAVMALTPRHTYQVLTKRPERLGRYIARADFHRINAAAQTISGRRDIAVLPTQEHGMVGTAWPLANVWIGTSVENQAMAAERIPQLLETPAAMRFLSCEPLLGPVDVRNWLTYDWRPIEPGEEMGRVDWVIIGGESGQGARSMNVEWARSLIDQCFDAKVACFMKQLGRSPIGVGPVVNLHGSDLDEWPEDLRVQAFPE